MASLTIRKLDENVKTFLRLRSARKTAGRSRKRSGSSSGS
ncbi:plasmid stability protein [Bradyrhizobium sp. LM6.11]